jgi:hypothetical protein
VIVLYHERKQALKGRPGESRGWTPTLDNAAFFDTPKQALESLAPSERADWVAVRIHLEVVPENELLLV